MSAIIVNDQAVKSALARILAAAENKGELLRSIGDTVAQNTRLRFASGTAPSGAKWKAVLRGGAPLRDKGLLANSITSRVTGDAVIVGTPYWWAATHQFGATIRAKSAKYLRFRINKRWAMKKQVKVPARPIFGISADDRSAIIQILTLRLTPK